MAAQDLSFFHDVVGQIEQEQAISAQDIAAALAYLIQRERPLQAPEAASTKPADSKRMEETRHRAESEGRPAPRRDRAKESTDAAMMHYRLEVGHQHGATPQNIVGAIANEAGIDSRYIGRIEIHEDYSTVDLPDGMSAEIFEHLKKVRVRQHPLNISRLGPSEPERARRRPTGAGERAARSPRVGSSEREPRPSSRRKREMDS